MYAASATMPGETHKMAIRGNCLQVKAGLYTDGDTENICELRKHTLQRHIMQPAFSK